MAEYPEFKHGTRGKVIAEGLDFSNKGKHRQAIVYIGTAPVHQVEGGAKNVNRPIVCGDIAEARKYLGYSDDWASYTLCEAMHVHFEMNGVGPLVFINVLDPNAHRKSQGGSATLTPDNGRVTIVSAEDAILDTVVVKSEGATLTRGTDYTATYDFMKKVINIVEKKKGSLGTSALSITWSKVDPAQVTEANVIGATDEYGLNTGVYAIKNVYNVTGLIPAFLLAPGFSSIPSIHNALYQNSQQISKHWNAWMFVDLPILTTDGNTVSLQNAPDWKNANGYNRDNESVFFPLAKGTDGKTYHLSVLNAANFQSLLVQNNGIPYMSGSNTECGIIEDLYFSENVTGRVYDDEIINRCLNANGINSAAYVGGRWAIWGMFAGSYDQENGTTINVNDTCLMMLYYLTNDFQHRRNINIDKPMPINDLKSIVAEEQTRVDALLGIGALTYGKVQLEATPQAKSDVYSGDFSILFNVTNTPLAKSLTATANWTADGFEVYFAAMDELAG
ncbi:MAG: hypothetical protein IJ188_06405 [Clostridia bacterium]|nr:hypothetical protein [Clostridia bacterium]